MTKRHTLRIGICSCASFYFGKFNGGSLRTDDGVVFNLVETIYERDKGDMRQNIIALRPHFLLDSHFQVFNECYRTELARNQYATNGNGTWRLYIGGMGPIPTRIRGNHVWEGESQPEPDEIISQLGPLMMNYPEKQHVHWLNTTTPPGWELESA